MTISNSQALTLLNFYYGADLDQVDLRDADAVAKAGLVAWSLTPFKIEAWITVEGEDAIVEWLDDDDLARWMGLLPVLPVECPVTIRSGSLPEMNVTVRLFDEGVEARQSSNAVAYHRARSAEDEGCAWAGPWLRGWHAAAQNEVAA